MEASLHRLRKSGTEAADEAPPAISDRREDLMHRTMSSIRRIRQERVDQDLLHRTIEDSGKFAYGTKMVEVWVWDPDMSKLCRPEGGKSSRKNKADCYTLVQETHDNLPYTLATCFNRLVDRSILA